MSPVSNRRTDLTPPVPAPTSPRGSGLLELEPVSEPRRRLRTETSATSGWAARLAARFPERPQPARR
jgi:hypothetical protein